jgi:hypothetical protein
VDTGGTNVTYGTHPATNRQVGGTFDVSDDLRPIGGRVTIAIGSTG